MSRLTAETTEPKYCWCSEPVHYSLDGNGWCRAHAPRCRSGAHFHGNCQCVGDDAFMEWYRSRCSCGHTPHRGLCTAYSGGTAYKCMCSRDQTDKLLAPKEPKR